MHIERQSEMDEKNKNTKTEENIIHKNTFMLINLQRTNTHMSAYKNIQTTQFM